MAIVVVVVVVVTVGRADRVGAFGITESLVYDGNNLLGRGRSTLLT